MEPGSVTNAMSRMSPPHPGRLLIRVTAASRGVVVARMRARRGIAPLDNIPDDQCRHGPLELVIRCKHPVIPVPVLPRRRHEIGEPVWKLKR
jgi:hypothetical protein